MNHRLAAITRAQWIALDLRNTVIHEVGHAIVGDHVDIKVLRIDIRLNASVAPQSLERRMTSGRCMFLPDLACGRNLQLFAVAGIVAEQLADDGGWIDGASMMDIIDGGDTHLSEEDAAGAGTIDEPLLDEAAGVLMRHWPHLISEAQHFVRIFREEHSADDDAVLAARTVLFELEAMASRFSWDVAK